MATGNKLALITGASAGIGECIANELAEAGYDVILVARREKALRGVANYIEQEFGVEAHVYPADLLEPDAVAALAVWVDEEGFDVDVLVNNAGVLEAGAFSDIDPDILQRMVQLNVGVLTDLLAYFLPAMQARGAGKVLNVASVAAFQPVVGLASYAATKAYVLSLTEALVEELRGSGVTVTALCPGITETAMMEHAGESNASFREVPAALVSDPKDVAEAGVRGMMKGEAIVIPGALNQATALLSSRSPKWILRRLTGSLGRRFLQD
jgi:short-subunit dehydrogenase